MEHKPDKTPYALKCLHKGQLVRYQQVEHVVNEKRVLQGCDHPFILRMVSTFNGKAEVYMLLDLALGGEVRCGPARFGTSAPHCCSLDADPHDAASPVPPPVPTTPPRLPPRHRLKLTRRLSPRSPLRSRARTALYAAAHRRQV